MKIILFLLFFLCVAPFFAQPSPPEQPLMCSDLAAATEATCTGSASCRACKNCKYCGHCNSGGSCGVCSTNTSNYRGGSRNSGSVVNRAYGSPGTSRNGNSVYNLPDDPYSEYYLKTLVVVNAYLNMRSGPGTNYQVLKRLEEDQLLTFLAMKGRWVKVRIRGDVTIGFVHADYIRVIAN